MSNIIAKLQNILFSVTISQLIAGMLGAVMVLIAVHFTEPHPRTIATVDITGIVNQFVKAQVKQNLPTKELQQRVNQFGHQLQITLNNIAQKRHVVLLVQEAVVSGAQDLTPIVKQQLFQTANERK